MDCPTSFWPRVEVEVKKKAKKGKERALEEEEDTEQRLKEAKKAAREWLSPRRQQQMVGSPAWRVPLSDCSFTSVRSSEASLTTVARKKREEKGILPVKLTDKDLSESVEWKQEWERSGDPTYDTARAGALTMERLQVPGTPGPGEREGTADSVKSTGSRRTRGEVRETDSPMVARKLDMSEHGEKRAGATRWRVG
jgi:hypothetical protein